MRDKRKGTVLALLHFPLAQQLNNFLLGTMKRTAQVTHLGIGKGRPMLQNTLVRQPSRHDCRVVRRPVGATICARRLRHQ